MNPMVLSVIRHTVLVECLAQRVTPITQDNHFTLYNLNLADQTAGQFGDIVVVHNFTPTQIDNNIGYYVANELLPLIATLAPVQLHYSEQEMFERYVGAIVRSIESDERQAWQLFYTNTLQRLAVNAPPANSAAPARSYDFIENFGAIYQHTCHLIDATELADTYSPIAGELAGYTVLDVATCFGFFPCFLANTTSQLQQGRTPRRIVGCDLNSALVNLARDYAWQQQFAHLEFVVADILTNDIAALQSRFQATTFDIVTAIHLLEHLEEVQMMRAIDNLWQFTGRRLIIAVPLEEVPDARFGHLQTFDRDKLLAIGQHIADNYHYYEYHGGWIVIDREEVSETPLEQRPMLELSEQRSSI